MRTLHTIGLLDRNVSRVSRLERRMGALHQQRTMGASNPRFELPTQEQIDAHPPGDAVETAGTALLNHFDADGVTSMHAADPLVLAFQNAWNSDIVSSLVGPNGKLDLDSAYGPNTQAALNVIVGGIAPAPNPAPAPSGSTVVLPTVVVPGTVPGKPASGGSDTGKIVLIGAGVAFALWWAFFRKKRRSVPAAANPRRRGKASSRRRTA